MHPLALSLCGGVDLRGQPLNRASVGVDHVFCQIGVGLANVIEQRQEVRVTGIAGRKLGKRSAQLRFHPLGEGAPHIIHRLLLDADSMWAP